MRDRSLKIERTAAIEITEITAETATAIEASEEAETAAAEITEITAETVTAIEASEETETAAAEITEITAAAKITAAEDAIKMPSLI